ncbi:helix-turn-helix domain-containing protein [Syntrophotalea acetylenivorans]|uniref:helix-turn-helix domain-containing protein n=1 Tax=Syntrophotalea acetylenivorans TaxID=1842532 RepID=UPI000A6206BF
MRRYSQLAQDQGCQIYALKKAGYTQSKITEVLRVHKATISRELKRNRGQRGYCPKQAINGPRNDTVKSLASESRLKPSP